MRILGIEPSSMILSQKSTVKKLKRAAYEQYEAKREGVKNPYKIKILLD